MNALYQAFQKLIKEELRKEMPETPDFIHKRLND